MNEGLIAAWQALVQPTDEVWVLGDFCFWRASDVLTPQAIFDQLPGSKHLIIGNHDEKNPKTMRLPWASKHDLHTLRWQEHRLIACHYGLETWKNAHHGYLHVHGHSHGSLRQIHHRWDVGVDPMGYAPVPVTTIIGWAAEQVFNPQDHHATTRAGETIENA